MEPQYHIVHQCKNPPNQILPGIIQENHQNKAKFQAKLSLVLDLTPYSYIFLAFSLSSSLLGYLISFTGFFLGLLVLFM